MYLYLGTFLSYRDGYHFLSEHNGITLKIQSDLDWWISQEKAFCGKAMMQFGTCILKEGE